MPSFGKSSKAKLQTVDPRLRSILENAIQIMDFTVLEGHRGEEAQEKAFREGRSKARFGQSKHNSHPSQAVDIAPYPIDWEDVESFVLLAGVIKAVAFGMGLDDQIRWGGDWDSDNRMQDERFRDYPHFEIKE